MVSIDSSNLQVQVRSAAPSQQQQQQQQPPSPPRRRPNFLVRWFRRHPLNNNSNNNNRRKSRKQKKTRAAVATRVSAGPPIPRHIFSTVNRHDHQLQQRHQRDVNITAAVPVDQNGVVLGATLPPSLIQPGSATHDPSGYSPSAVFRREVVAQPPYNTNNRNYVSSELPEHTFWLSRNLEPALAVISPYHAGEVRDYPQAILVQENLEDALVLPKFISRRLPVYTESEARDLFRQMCTAVHTLHQQHVAHRTLHLNHIAVSPEGRVLLRGFQHAVLLQEDPKTFTWYTDTPVAHARRWDWYAFRAPELDAQLRHGTAVDVWSLGACLSMLLTGLPPFRGTGRDLKRQKQSGETAPYDIVVPSLAAQDLVRQMIQADPDQRPTLKQVMDHEWMKMDEDSDSFDDTDVLDLTLAQCFLQDWGHKSR